MLGRSSYTTLGETAFTDVTKIKQRNKLRSELEGDKVVTSLVGFLHWVFHCLQKSLVGRGQKIAFVIQELLYAETRVYKEFLNEGRIAQNRSTPAQAEKRTHSTA